MCNMAASCFEISQFSLSVNISTLTQSIYINIYIYLPNCYIITTWCSCYI